MNKMLIPCTYLAETGNAYLVSIDDVDYWFSKRTYFWNGRELQECRPFDYGYDVRLNFPELLVYDLPNGRIEGFDEDVYGEWL